MKYVKMLVDVAEGNVPHNPDSSRSRLKVTKHRKLNVPLAKGVVLPMDDGGADKFVARKLGKVVSVKEYEAQFASDE